MTDRSNRKLFASLLVVTLLVAVGLSQLGSENPDGLEFVAEQEGFADTATEGAFDGSPLAGYGDSAASTAVAGLLGVLATLAIGYGLFWMIRRRNPETAGARTAVED